LRAVVVHDLGCGDFVSIHHARTWRRCRSRCCRTSRRGWRRRGLGRGRCQRLCVHFRSRLGQGERGLALGTVQTAAGRNRLTGLQLGPTVGTHNKVRHGDNSEVPAGRIAADRVG